MKYFIANWKANKNYQATIDWVKVFKKLYRPKQNVRVIVCPPFPFVPDLKKELKYLENVYVGSQTISSFEKGSFTGEVTALSLVGLVSYAIIGHSERRKNFSEKDDDLAIKVILAKKYAIEPIYCIRDEKDQSPKGVRFVAYEPVAAIGTGQNESPEKVVEMKKKLKITKENIFIYGGSVNEKNIKDYLKTENIDGFLIGGASLDPERFVRITNQA